MAEDRHKEQYVFIEAVGKRPCTVLSPNCPTGNLEYIDETADWTKHYAQGVQSDTGSDDDTQDEAPLNHVRNSSFHSTSGQDGPSRPLHSGQMGPPSPVQVIPRSSDVFEYPSKRRKTNESMQAIARSSSHNHDSPSSNFSLPLQSPNFSFSGLQPFDRPLSAHGSSHSLEYASLLGSASRSDHGQPHDTIVPTDHSNRVGTNDFNGGNVGTSDSAESPYDLLSPRFWTQQSVWPYPSVQEACLMRYFVENLAHWVSLCSIGHFGCCYTCDMYSVFVHFDGPGKATSKMFLSKVLTFSSLIFAIQNATSLLSYHSERAVVHHSLTPSSRRPLDIYLD
jgi:hypothetical protein